MHDQLLAAQAAIEQESLDLGVKRYREARAKDETNTRPGKRLLVESLKPLSGAIAEWIESVTNGKPTANANLGYFLQDVDPEVAAYLTARAVLNGMTKNAALQTVAFGVASLIEDAVNFDALKEQDPRAYRQLQRKIAKSSDQGYRHVVMRKQQKYAGVRAIKWGRTDKLKMGILLIDLMERNVIVNGAPLFQRQLHTMGARSFDARYTLMPTEAAARWLEASHARCELLEPMHLPMVVEPLPWTTPTDGGYLSEGCVTRW
jgi:DNA-directed RNA polymerase